MLKKLSILLTLSLFIGFAQAQTVQLFTENFESGGAPFTLNSGGPGGPSGDNIWITNDEYTGTPTYPNTCRQDSTVSGTIFNAPFSTYMHIHDQTAAPAIANSNFDPSSTSDNFAFTTDGFCTLGMVNVRFTFFWKSEGNPNAYGEVYYSVDGGAWTQTGAARYDGQDKWRYEVIADPAFEKVANLRIGFRWVNGSGGAMGNSFAIDDIIAVGELDPISPAQLFVNAVSPDPVCQLSFATVNWSLSEFLCAGTYQLQLSNATGGFGTPVSLGTFGIGSNDTTGIIGGIIPGTTPPGTCYRIRLVRIGPTPLIIGNASPCFEVIPCPNTITTLGAVVMNDADTTCVQSAIDISFASTGVYLPPNIYTAQLSDSSGSFANPDTIGASPDMTTYDPALGIPPGTVSGLIPDVPPGCNYYIRIVSSSPNTIGTQIGPFCLKQCDVTTNNTMDLSFCIWDTIGGGMCDSIEIETNSYDDSTQYFAGNRFRLQLRDMMMFGLVNDGDLFAVFDTNSGKFVICVPYLDSLTTVLGIAPGSYYARIIADSTDATHGLNGTVIRLSIGAPASSPSILIASDSVFCDLGIQSFTITPWNPMSSYRWFGDITGSPITTPPGVRSLNINFTGAGVRTFQLSVQEVNNGCFGPFGPPTEVNVISAPAINISGPEEICFGDTVCYHVDFVQETYYEWSVSSGRIIQVSNNEMCIAWDTVGTPIIYNYALNDCGEGFDTFEVNVFSILDVDLGPDQSVCAGETVTINAETDGFNYDLATTFNGNQDWEGNMFDITATGDLTINKLFCHYNSPTPVDIRVYYRLGSHVGFEMNQFAWTLAYSQTGLVPNPVGTPTEIPINLFIDVAAGQTIALYITTTDGSDMVHSNAPVAASIGDVADTDGILEIKIGTKNVYPFGAFTGADIWNGSINYTTKAGLVYGWSTGDDSSSISLTPTENTTVTLYARDTTGCGFRDQMNIIVNPMPTVDAGPDTSVCIDFPDYYIPATATDANTYIWTPVNSLDNPNILNPTSSSLTDMTYYVEVSDSSTGCKSRDTITVIVKDCNDPIRVPQAFTPNNDGANDFFTVFGEGIVQYEIHIYNRWGEQVYYSADETELNDLNRGWDGTYKGNIQDLGTFVYYIRAVDTDGLETEKQGNVTLIH